MSDPVSRDAGGTEASPEALGRIAVDLEGLGKVAHRYAGTDGEREMLHQVRSRVAPDLKTRTEGFVAFTSPGFVLGAHALALFLGGLVGLYWPILAAIACMAVTISLIAEGSGRFSVLRWLLPKVPSYNLVWHGGARERGALGTLVVSAPIDAPRFQPQRPRWFRRPMQLLVVAATVLTIVILLRAFAEPWGRPTLGMYVASLGVLAGAMGIGVVAHRRAPGLQDASGPTALLELLRRFSATPPEGLDVWLVFTGCGYAYQNGMHAFLAMRGARLHQPSLVIALSDPGKGPLRAVVSEGPLWAQAHRPTGPALVERLRWAGLDLPSSDSSASTDARAAMLWGNRGLALRGGSKPSTAEDTLRAVEVTEAIARVFAEDLRQVPELHPRVQHLLPSG